MTSISYLLYLPPLLRHPPVIRLFALSRSFGPTWSDRRTKVVKSLFVFHKFNYVKPTTVTVPGSVPFTASGLAPYYGR